MCLVASAHHTDVLCSRILAGSGHDGRHLCGRNHRCLAYPTNPESHAHGSPLTPSEWGQVGIGGVLSAFVTAVGAYFVKRVDRVKPEALTVPQIETITKGLGELIDDLQHERRENRHVIRNLRMELEGLRGKLDKAEATNARMGVEIARLRAVVGECEEMILSNGLPIPVPLEAKPSV